MVVRRGLGLLALAAFASPALAGEAAFSSSVSAGLLVPDPSEPVPPASWMLTPALTYWFDSIVGIEASVGLSTTHVNPSRDKLRWLYPSLSVVFDPVPARLRVPVRPILRVGGGIRDTRITPDDGARTHRVDGTFSTSLGVAVPIAGALRFHADAGFLLSAGKRGGIWPSPSEAFVLTAGLDIKLGIGRDKDKDDVIDRHDACPDVAEDFDGFDDLDGCPEDDDDKDGVRDILDGCRDEAEDVDGFEDADGCVDPDNDRDGIDDAADACPDQAGDEAHQGCPPSEPEPEPESVLEPSADVPVANP